MIEYKKELNLKKHERNMIKSEIADLKEKISVEGRRNNRFEVNNFMGRKFRLEIKLNELSLNIVDLEKKINGDQNVQIKNTTSKSKKKGKVKRNKSNKKSKKVNTVKANKAKKNGKNKKSKSNKKNKDNKKKSHEIRQNRSLGGKTRQYNARRRLEFGVLGCYMYCR